MDQSSKSGIISPLLYALTLSLGMFLGFKLHDSIKKQMHSKSNTESNLHDLIKLISDKYVDSLDEKVLYKSGIEGVLSHLDPHTVYIPKEELGRVNEELEGHFYGIGVEFFIYKDTVIISNVLQDGPCYKTAMHPGDKLISINDSVVAGVRMSDENIIGKIRGRINTPIKLGLLHPDCKKENLTVHRNSIPIKSVPAAFMLTKTTGYILIRMFSETTYDEFVEAFQKLKEKGIENLIIDVRDNPGGYMNAVAKIADEFIADNHVLISTKGKNRKEEFNTERKGLFEEGKIAVLINENSASASEILAGVIQDLDRGLILGRRSFGKGLVQEQFELPDGAALRITTARYYLPSGRCIQRSYANGKSSYKDDLIQRYHHGELTTKDSLEKHTTQKAFLTLKKRKVYGDEGITPDVFVALDTATTTNLRRFYEQHVASLFSTSYYYLHPSLFSPYPSMEDFVLNFKPDLEMQQRFTNFLISQGFEQNQISLYWQSTKVQNLLKAEFAKLRYSYNGYYRSSLEQDQMIQRALDSFAN